MWQGMLDEGRRRIADLLVRGLHAVSNATLGTISGDVVDLCRCFPLYPERRYAG
jgi:hypothetical protein